MPAKRLKKPSSGPNTIEGRTIVAAGNCARTAASPAALVRPYLDGGLGVRADGRDLDEALTPAAGAASASCCAPIGVHRLEPLAAVLVEHAHQIDAGSAPSRARASRRHADIGLDHLDLADIAQHAQPVAEARAAHRHPNPQAPLGQGPHHLGRRESPSRRKPSPAPASTPSIRLSHCAG